MKFILLNDDSGEVIVNVESIDCVFVDETDMESVIRLRDQDELVVNQTPRQIWDVIDTAIGWEQINGG